jgi:hypothetical protein
LIENTIDAAVQFHLPDQTLVIRADNQDSFQGPVDAKLGVNDELTRILKLVAQRASGSDRRVEVSPAQDVRLGVHRTPEARFADIKDFPFETH